MLHQTAVIELGSRLLAACPKGLKVFVAPLDFRPTAQRSLQPDVLVCRREDVGPNGIEKPLLLAVEILSSSTRMKDLLLKRGVYEEAGVTSYWIFDPVKVELTVLELSGGSYVRQAVVHGEEVFEAKLPFSVRVVAADLVDEE
ncbi:Uma2 family endonuclease [Kribbella catacumbae]|uniref:Uma2 family endonuclease n=1 Tax=Kribbella catacumbae TaxID=460086 RepID=UPI0003804D9E|nr:Uma2 family endonuclease [Kribbella catacumbae]